MNTDGKSKKAKRFLSTLRQGAIAIAAAGVLATGGLSDANADDKKFLLKTPSAFKTDLPITGTSATYFADLLKKHASGQVPSPDEFVELGVDP